MKRNKVREALEAIVAALDCGRDRLRRLEYDWSKMGTLQQLAVTYKIGGCGDPIEQAVKVGKAALRE